MDGTGPTGATDTGEARRTRRRPPVIPLLVLLALLGGLALLVVARSSPQQQIRRLIDRQIKLAVAGRFGQLHATLSPKAKAACGAAHDFAGELQGLLLSEPDFWYLIDTRNIQIQVDGDRALVTYTVTYNGRVVERATLQDPDIYIRWTEPTRLGPKPSKASIDAQLAALDRQQKPGPLANPLPPKQFKAARDRIIDAGRKQPVLWKKGQWYDEVDNHVHC
jgi:type II secretory pathway pseudopilin PulG